MQAIPCLALDLYRKSTQFAKPSRLVATARQHIFRKKTWTSHLRFMAISTTLLVMARESFVRRRGSAVTKKDLAKRIAHDVGVNQMLALDIVQRTFDGIIETLVQERRIELRNFGVFEVKKRKPREARNPRTGDRVTVPQRFVVTFKPGREMEERIAALRGPASDHPAQGVVPPSVT
jgi:integration host factor subunit beta